MSSIGRGGSFTWFDLDGDGDLDYLLAGAYFVPGGNGLVEAQLNIFSNDAPVVNGLEPNSITVKRSVPPPIRLTVCSL